MNYPENKKQKIIADAHKQNGIWWLKDEFFPDDVEERSYRVRVKVTDKFRTTIREIGDGQLYYSIYNSLS